MEKYLSGWHQSIIFRQGDWEPIILLVSPKKQQMATVAAEYSINEKTKIKTEFAVSKYDINLFSGKDKGNDNAVAAKVQFVKEEQPIKLFKKALFLQTNIGYEYVQSRFKPLERLRNIEFNRDWSLPYDIAPADEHLTNAGLKLSDKTGNKFRYEITNYNRSDKFNGFRHLLEHYSMIKGWKITDQVSLANINTATQTGVYLRPTIDVSKQLKKIKNIIIGANYLGEHNKLTSKIYDTLVPLSFAFNVWQAYIKSDESKLNKWGVSYFTRTDFFPVANKLILGR